MFCRTSKKEYYDNPSREGDMSSSKKLYKKTVLGKVLPVAKERK
jgi:hypothetical protein